MGQVQSERSWVKLNGPWGFNWTVQTTETGGHVSNFLTVHFQTSGLLTLTFMDRPLLSFDSFGRFTFSRKTVHFGSNDRPVSVVYFGSRPPTFGRTVHFWKDRPLLRDCPLSPLGTVHFGPDSIEWPSTLGPFQRDQFEIGACAN